MISAFLPFFFPHVLYKYFGGEMISFLKAGTWVVLALVDAVEKKTTKIQDVKGVWWAEVEVSLEKWELWQCIPKGSGDQHCHSFCHIPACSAAEGEFRHSTAATATWAPLALLGHRWLCLELCLQQFSLQPCPWLSEDMGRCLSTAYWKLHGLDVTLFVFICYLSSLQTASSTGTSDLEIQNFFCYKNTEQWY